MYMHPAVAQLQCAGRLNIVDSLHKSLGYRLVEKGQETSYDCPSAAYDQRCRTSK